MGAQRPRRPRDARRAYGQNFLADKALAAQLVRDARIKPGELVVEIGAGAGILTAELARRGARVLAIEIDSRWAHRLWARFQSVPQVTVIEGDARTIALPNDPFHVVANLPFSATTDILHRLLDDPVTPLERADLLVQWEVARKRAGRPRSAVSAQWSPWWRFRLGRRLPRTAFRPLPPVDAAVLIVERRARPLVPVDAQPQFAAFVQALFSGSLARHLDAQHWATLFSAHARSRRVRD